MAEFIAGLSTCLPTVGSDTSSVEFLGITVEPDPEQRRITLYSNSNGHAICRTQVATGGELLFAKRVILPRAFCEQMVQLYGDLDESAKEAVTFEIAQSTRPDGLIDRYALFSAGEATLYGRLLDPRQPQNFAAALADVPGRSEFVAIPEQFQRAVQLATAVCEEQRSNTEISIERGWLRLVARADRRGERGRHAVEQAIQIADRHPDISVRVKPQLLKRASEFDQMRITSELIVLIKSAGDALYAVACAELTQPAEEQEPEPTEDDEPEERAPRRQRMRVRRAV
jgi:hypothetical protein